VISLLIDGAIQEPAKRRSKTTTIAIVVLTVLVISSVVALVVTSVPSGTTTTATSTSISASAAAIIASAVQTNPSGFTLESSKPTTSGSSAQSGDWAILEQSDGSEANVTVIVYPSTNASQAYFDRFVAGVKGLPDYTDITSDLGSFKQYGKCYGYGEDISAESISVVNGVCTKGNVFLSVHLASDISFLDLEGDLTSIMGALYQNAT
jgi:hypothetical protein